MRRLLSVSFSLLCAAACGGTAPAPTSTPAPTASSSAAPGGPEIPRAEFGAKLAKAFCDATAPCCKGGVTYDEGVCTKQFLDQVGLGEVIAKAKTYDGKHAAKCLEAVKPLAASCESGRDPIMHLAECAATLTGPSKTGGPCEENTECAKPEKGDAFCWKGGMVDQPGRCAVSLPPALGAACFSPLGTEDKAQLVFSECNEDRKLLCDKATNKCGPRVKDGGKCEAMQECEDGSVCSGAGTCKSLAGKSCKRSNDCAMKQACVDGKCAPGKKLGDACSDFADCAEGMCTGLKTCGTWAVAFLCKAH